MLKYIAIYETQTTIGAGSAKDNSREFNEILRGLSKKELAKLNHIYRVTAMLYIESFKGYTWQELCNELESEGTSIEQLDFINQVREVIIKFIAKNFKGFVNFTGGFGAVFSPGARFK